MREHEALAVLKAWRQRLGVALGQRLVGAKTNAIPNIGPLLEQLTLSQRVVTVDALPTPPTNSTDNGGQRLV